ncbi:MAG: acyltransferase family protein [Myxococcota bacterium]
MSSLKYRADIDGLRAVAVLPVLFFHTDLPGASGGYVGVDVFFVISGFLITSILHKEIGAGRFSIVRFYERRVRRLWPALVVVVLFTTVLAWLFLLPPLLRDYGQSLVAVTVFASNVLFYLEAGYFDGPAEEKPLLHTWSLAVEEQFYLFFPLLLLLLHRRGWPLVRVLLGLFVVSLAGSVWRLPSDPSLVFYQLPFRAWELLMGGLLAVGGLKAVPAKAAHGLGLVGLGLIAGSIVLYTPATPFPGLAAVPPCLGTALVIHAGRTEGGVAGRFLGLAPLVFIGKMSYSLYLWHWPLIVFARLLAPTGHLGTGETLAVLALSFVGAAFSWKVIEQPFRSAPPRGRFTRRTMFAGAIAVSVAWLAVGAGLELTRGAPGRLSPEGRRLAEAATDFSPAPEPCERFAAGGQAASDLGEGLCLVGAPESTPRYLLWGDSHGGILSHGVAAAAAEVRAPGLAWFPPGCPPLMGLEKDESVAPASSDAACGEGSRALVRLIEETASVEAVVLIGRWAYYATGQGVGLDSERRIAVWRAGEERDADAQAALVADALVETARRLHALGKRVFVLRMVPELPGFGAARAASAALVGGTPVATNVARTDADARVAALEGAFTRLEEEGLATVLDPRGRFCRAGRCHALDAEGLPLYFDDNHVTTSAARALAAVFAPVFASLSP